VEPATGIEPATCGLRIVINPAPVQQIKDLRMQIDAERGTAYANPQLSATKVLRKISPGEPRRVWGAIAVKRWDLVLRSLTRNKRRPRWACTAYRSNLWPA